MSKRSTVHAIVYTALMAALIYALALLLTFPFLGSKIHPSNVGDMLAGLILGPWLGGLASGIGNFFFDITHGYSLIMSLVTFVTKFLSAMLVGLIAGAWRKEGPVLDRSGHLRVILGCVLGGLAYIAMYMTKTLIVQSFFTDPFPEEGVLAVMLTKLPGTAINNGFAAVVTPILYTALRPALNAIGVLDQLRPEN
ncbi:MAG: ECF transporter S component [Oscillospiraceae bacterium]|nr:ECF transporter S component [Oscillospiraceae bacterium]MBR4193990.1 ECF transporter S component [Oscillospiraceae bacterium]